MAYEKKLAAVAPQALTADGTQFGLVTVADSCKYRVKTTAYLINTAGAKLPVQIKKVISPTQLIVGEIDNKLSSWNPLDISSWTVASGAKLGAQEQDKNKIPDGDHYVAIYEADPIVADRVIPVDCNGNFYDANNPLPVAFDGTVNIGQVRVTACDNDPLPGAIHSSIRISDCINDLKINPDGSINVIVEGPAPKLLQNITLTYDETAPVPPGFSTVILTYMVPFGDKASLQRIFASGENIGRYDVLVNGTPISTQRTYFGGALNVDFLYNSSNGEGLPLSGGDIVTVKVLQTRPNTAIYEATLEVILNPIIIGGETVVATYNEILALAAFTTASIVTYTVPIGKTATLQRVFVSGENIARFDVFVNASVIGTKRTYFGGDLNDDFEFSGPDGGGVALAAGDVVTIKVIHHRPMAGSFEGTIEVIEF